MAILSIPEQNFQSKNPKEIQDFLAQKGILFDQWQAKETLSTQASQEEVLTAYAHVLEPYMNQNGYKVADVININSKTPNYPAIRAKFLDEHTHTEDEVRFFVEGQGLFWFHLPNSPVFNVLCQAGDLISVPANSKHWFDAGKDNPSVKAIRIFIDMEGWVPHYTGSDLAQKYAAE